MKKTFAERIAAMNAMYKLPVHSRPTLPEDAAERLVKFKAALLDEVHDGQQRKQARRGRQADLRREREVSQRAELLEAGTEDQGALGGKDEG